MPIKDPERQALYWKWHAMIDRCNNPEHKSFYRYGGRGITVCDRWSQFDHFVKDMGPRPPRYSIERIDNDKGYSPDNCRWASSREQAQNRGGETPTVVVVLDGSKMSLSDACQIAGIERSRVYKRIAAGWTADQAFTVPFTRRRPHICGRLHVSKKLRNG